MMKAPSPTIVRRHRSTVALVSALGAMLMSPTASAAAGLGEEMRERSTYVLLSSNGDSAIMSGSTQDLRTARQLRAGHEPLLYVREEGTAYVIRDPATLRQARTIFEPQERLGAKQADLGSRQATLGQRQAHLGSEQTARVAARSTRA